jgi:CRISPR/Cas system-associated endonuclease/helicase Cas3
MNCLKNSKFSTKSITEDKNVRSSISAIHTFSLRLEWTNLLQNNLTFVTSIDHLQHLLNSHKKTEFLKALTHFLPHHHHNSKSIFSGKPFEQNSDTNEIQLSLKIFELFLIKFQITR